MLLGRNLRYLFCGTYRRILFCIIGLFLIRFLLTNAYCHFWQFIFSFTSCSTEHYLPKTFDFPVRVLASPSKCGANTKLLIFVPSLASNADERAAVRETWGRSFVEDSSVKLVFAVASDHKSHADLQLEASKFHDLIWFDFNEHYHNLSLKMFHVFNWIATNCSTSKYVFRADPDVFVFKLGLEHFIQDRSSSHSPALYGYCRDYDCVMRFPSSKTCMPKTWYGDHWYPRYCFGFSYLFTSDTLKIILPIWRKWPSYFPLDDILFTGLIADSSPVKIPRYNVKGLFDYQTLFDQFPCRSKQVTAAAYVDLNEAREKWSVYTSKCSQS